MTYALPKLRLSLQYYLKTAKRECGKNKYSTSCKIAYENVEEISSVIYKEKSKVTFTKKDIEMLEYFYKIS